jgi:hypothetical protein
MFLTILLFVIFLFIIFSFLYHQALMEAWHDHGFFGVVNMYFAILIHVVAKTFLG